MSSSVSTATKLDAALNETLRFLASGEALAQIAADPYWPKWEGPWWRMGLLWELGRAKEIPKVAVRAMVAAINGHYLRDFPAAEGDLPPGKDPYRDVICHCAVGVMYQILCGCGVAVDEEIPWLRPWLLRYQLPDGGLNCDFGKKVGSLVSTTAALEAILHCTPRPYTAAELNFMTRAANYLLERKLGWKKSSGEVINSDWLAPAFPRFYEYDVLRGLTVVTQWAEKTGTTLESESVQDATSALDKFFNSGNPVRRSHLQIRSLRQAATGEWMKALAASFPLLEISTQPEIGLAILRREWNAARLLAEPMKIFYYRESIVEYFESISDSEAQRMLGPTEAFCKWFDDLYLPCFDPKICHPGVHEKGLKDFESCFSREELEAMAHYHEYFNSIRDFNVDREWNKITQDPLWQKLTQEAMEALEVFQSGVR